MVEFFSPLYLATIYATTDSLNESLVRKFGVLQRSYDFSLI